MNKTKTGKLHLLRFALVVPVVTFLLLAFRHKHEIYKATFKEQNTKTTKFILGSLTYSVRDKKVETAVKNDKKNCLLKTGQALSLEMVFNEKARLKNLLEKNGYNNIDDHAITFMIDTTSGNNSFSIQVNINLAKNELSESKEEPGKKANKISMQTNLEKKSIQSEKPASQPHFEKVSDKDELNNKQLIFDNKLSAI